VTSPLPPKRRDSRNLADLLRQDRQRLTQLDRGLVGGRFPPARPLKPIWADDGEDDFDDPAILFENTDTATVPFDGKATPIILSHVPLEGSEQVFYRGMGLKRSDWYYATEKQIVIPGEPWFRAGDRCWVDYAYEDSGDDTPDAPNPVLVGTNTAIGNISSIALPAGVLAGDLIVVTTACSSSVSTSDSRIVGTHQAFGPGELVAWGYADGSGSPLAVSVTIGSGYGSTALAVYRGVRVSGAPVQNTTTGSTLTAATIPNAQAALVAVLAWTGTVSAGIGEDTTGAWISDTWENHVKTYVRLARWSSSEVTTTPPGSFGLTGDNNGFGAVTLQLVVAE
jgi:hypothetical protein